MLKIIIKIVRLFPFHFLILKLFVREMILNNIDRENKLNYVILYRNTIKTNTGEKSIIIHKHK